MLLNGNLVENSGTSRSRKQCLRETPENADQSQLFTSDKDTQRLVNDHSDGQDGNDSGIIDFVRKNVDYHHKPKLNIVKIQSLADGN